MIQTTIQNSCAVDGYKRSRDAASARRPEGLCGRGSLPRLSPRQAQSCGLRHVCPFPKKKHAKKQTNKQTGMGQGEQGAADAVRLYGGARRFFGVIPRSADEPRGPSRREPRTVASRCHVPAGARAGDAEASRGPATGRDPDPGGGRPSTGGVPEDARRRPLAWPGLGVQRPQQTRSPGPGCRRPRPGRLTLPPGSTGLSCSGKKPLRKPLPAPSGPPPARAPSHARPVCMVRKTFDTGCAQPMPACRPWSSCIWGVWGPRLCPRVRARGAWKPGAAAGSAHAMQVGRFGLGGAK